MCGRLPLLSSGFLFSLANFSRMASINLFRMAESSESPEEEEEGLEGRVGVGEGRGGRGPDPDERGGCPLLGGGDEAAVARRGVVGGREGRRVVEGRLCEGRGR